MKSMARVFLPSLLLLSLATLPTLAQTAGPAASGVYTFTLEDGLTRAVEFDSRTDERGITTGRMTYKDQTPILDEDDDGDPNPRPETKPSEIYVVADFENMTVEKNRAVLNGVVVESSHRIYIGRWVQLVVEDNALNERLPDRLVWSLCRPEPGGWIPSDFDRDKDDGAFLSWWATDAERKDDVGIPSRNLIPGERRGCEALALSSYAFADVKKAEGDIKVVP
jgi:hypothetical protein